MARVRKTVDMTICLPANRSGVFEAGRVEAFEALPPLHGLYCCIIYPDGMGYNTIGSSLFDAAAKALEWVEVGLPIVRNGAPLPR
jgi:hypothetical protein